MITGYEYELWNGKKVIGRIYTNYPIGLGLGDYLQIDEIPTIKQPYQSKVKTMRFRFTSRVIETYRDRCYRKCIDVRFKSKRQIQLLKKYYGCK